VGTIIDKLTYVQVDNPVFILDEIDKVGRDRMESNVAGALLEVLDPEHNRGFRDLFLDVPYDLSKILFITTANTDDIPPALLDRLEVIYCSGYAIEEKVQIALHHILPNLMRSVDIQPSELVISEQIIKTIITTYTFESGVRSLKRLLDTICRKAIAILDRKESTIVKVTKKNLESFLGAPTISLENTIPKTPSVGRVMGLGYNNSGNGCIIMIEAISVAGSGKFSITGNLGRVMEESSKIAFIVAKNLIHLVEGPRNNKIEPRNLDTYLHFPTASQKDGPSAGVGICLAILSSLLDKKIKNNFAITGEINLQGEVMPIGGILEKMQAAVLHNLEYIYLPQANLCNVKEIPEIIKSKIKIVYIKNIREILKKVFL
jgi:ATP-dependent Lon protease